MRRLIPGSLLSIVLSVAGVGEAQVLSRPTPSPSVNATSAVWQGRGEPIFHAGNYYYPTGASVFFDGHVMVPSGSYDGVPLYVDTTVEPHSLILVPIGRSLMRPYERRRSRDLAGTAGSRTPSFPVDPSGELPWWNQQASVAARVRIPVARVVMETEPAVPPPMAPPPPEPPLEPPDLVVRLDVVRASQSLERADSIAGDQGVWIEFEGSRWFSSGPAADYEAGRFIPVGSYRGFDVYRDTDLGADIIFVRIVPGGAVAPYSRR